MEEIKGSCSQLFVTLVPNSNKGMGKSHLEA